ncbi:suppressor of actin, putative [Entamoeba dispar SAW760]|uniref:phosphoinositide 5-phosphatase n=1 Tax=Entamoeba dispar (strain ATCC PRA-260 / SAW760) TaxID=370354 RepID=B0ER95_ENTDS|nr:suppressor of actin, putative [Entamoeba dispar SAW760]EDR22943.1 suppressor of actin, putative [Entamoeba dispar SAW760]|eukprot:EDR22943.1 suppressor of actin, putative [Entamoeba dispar SAW760]
MTKPITISYLTDGIFLEKEGRRKLSFKYEEKIIKQELLKGQLLQEYKFDELMGFIKLSNCIICIGIKGIKCIEINGQIIKNVNDIKILPLINPTIKNELYKIDNKLIQDIKKMLDECLLYYSYDMNITLNFQEIKKNNNKIDNRFYWNKSMHKMIEEFEEWKIIFVDGFIRSTKFEYGINYILFSRRDCSRTGLRFSSRGGDINGNVSNFVETEQIIEKDGMISSFVQIRGTIPLIWKTNEEDTFRPKGKFYQTIYQDWCITNHFKKLKEIYGDIIVINLLDNHGPEKILHDMYEFYLGLNNKLKVDYFAFDFHKECINNKYENIKYLLNSINKRMMTFNFFTINNKGKILNQQTGVVRTNCIDCLDRTNVIQSCIGKMILKLQLKEFNIQNPQLIISMNTDYMNIWADHANQMSFRYTGTKAMKTDYTRNGKRGFSGVLSDGKTSVKRSFISMTTGQYQKPQEILNLILGKIFFSKQQESCNNVILCINNVLKTDISMKKSNQIKIHIHITKTHYIEYFIENGLCISILLDDIIACDITHDPRILLLYTKITSLPKMLFISEISLSYQLAFQLNKLRLIKSPSTLNLFNIKNNSSSHLLSSLSKEINIRFITWNMEKILIPPDGALLNEIMKENDKDIIIIQLNKCNYDSSMFIGDYQPPFDLFKNIFLLLNAIKSPYVLVAVHTTDIIAQCILLKKEKYKKLHNVEVSNVYFEKSKPQKWSKLKCWGSAILFNINETTLAFLVLHPLQNIQEDESMFIKSQIDLNTDIQEIFFTTFEQPPFNKIPSFDTAIRRTKAFASNGIIFQRSIWDCIDSTSKNLLQIESSLLNEGNEIDLKDKTFQNCITSTFSFKDFPTPSFIDSLSLKVNIINIHLKLLSKIDKPLLLTFNSKVLTSVVTTLSILPKRYETNFIQTVLILNHFNLDVLKRYWITCTITEKEHEIGRFILPLTFIITNQYIEKCIVYHNRKKIGECLIHLSKEQKQDLYQLEPQSPFISLL